MKFSCSQKELFAALNITIKAINNSTTLPVLNNIYIKAEENSITLSATNLEVAITNTLSANVISPGEVTVPAKLLTSYVGLLKTGEVEVTLVDGTSISLKTPESKTTIKGLAADEFPAIPVVENIMELVIDGGAFFEAISYVSFAASLNNSRPILTGVYFEAVGTTLKIVATDSYRLSEKTIILDKPVEKDVRCIIPARTVSELGKILSGTKDSLNIRFSENQVLFQFQDIRLVSRLIEGQFPDYAQIIPKEPKTHAKVPLSDFVLAIKRVNLFAKENSNNVKLEIFDDGKIKLTTQATQFGSEEEVLQSHLQGEGNSIALNSEYLLDVFSHINASDVVLALDTSLTPLTISIPEREDFLHIVMPLKL